MGDSAAFAAFTLDSRLRAVRAARKTHQASLTGGARAEAEAKYAAQRAALENISRHLSKLGQAGGAPLDDLRYDQNQVAEGLKELDQDNILGI